MNPNFEKGELVILDKYSILERGDVIVFHPPGIQKEFYVKRIVGLPGETIEIEKDSIFLINNKSTRIILNETSYSLLGTTEVKMYNYFLLGADEYYVLGDNRENSSDSRYWGPVKKDLITGKVLIKV